MDGCQYPWVVGEKRNIAFDAQNKKALVGSSCTLVAEEYFASSIPMCSEVASLLMGVIALDTINMDVQAGIGTDRDRVALEKLRGISTHSQNELFELVRGAKLDPEFWHLLSVDDVLRIDYKSFQSDGMATKNVKTLGMASAMMPLEGFLNKQGLFDSVSKILQEQNLSLLVVMTFVHHPAPHRELLICADSTQSDLFRSVVEHLQNGSLNCRVLPAEQAAAQTAFQSASTEAGSCPQLLCAALSQGDVKASRKQVAPLLVELLENN